MSPEQLALRISRFQQAVTRLEEACGQPFSEFIRDSVIQRFKFCYELAWKMLKVKLEVEGIEASTPRQVIQESIAAHFFEDGNLWTEMLHMRNLTSHTYDEALAQHVFTFVCGEGRALFRSLRRESETWLP